MIILTGEDANKLVAAIRLLELEIRDLKDGTAHKCTCGCAECDDRARNWPDLKSIG